MSCLGPEYLELRNGKYCRSNEVPHLSAVKGVHVYPEEQKNTLRTRMREMR